MKIPFLTDALTRFDPQVRRSEIERARNEGALRAVTEIARVQAQTAVPAPYGTFWRYSSPSPRRKPQAALSVDEMRRLARTFDVLRIPIEHLKREARAIRWKIVPREESDDESSSARSRQRCREAWRFFDTAGGNGTIGLPRSDFETKVLDDLLVIGCFAVARWYDDAGRLAGQGAIDAGTIRVRVDESGWRDPEHPYEQWLSGGPVGDPLTSEDLYYAGIHAATTTPYYTSPIEWILAPILGGMRADEWDRAFFEGDHPGGLMLALDKELKPDQVAMWRGFIREALEGETIARRSLITVPAGTQLVSDTGRRDGEFGEFQLWMLRRIFAIYGVQPSSAGFAGEQYKVSQEGSNAQTSRFGAAPIIGALKELYDDTLERLGFGDLEVAEAGDDESLQELAEPVERLVTAGILTRNEGRRRLGYKPLAGGDTSVSPTSSSNDSLTMDLQ